MKWMIFFLCLGLSQGYKIISLPTGSEEVEHSLKVRFSTQMVEATKVVVSTITETKYETCYSAEAGIRDCNSLRRGVIGQQPRIHVPRVEVDGVEVSWESLISPSRVKLLSSTLKY